MLAQQGFLPSERSLPTLTVLTVWIFKDWSGVRPVSGSPDEREWSGMQHSDRREWPLHLCAVHPKQVWTL